MSMIPTILYLCWFILQLAFWNKNVSPQGVCGGVALDSNFDVAWKQNHTISSCSQLYPGPEPFSEAESQAIKDVIHKHATRIIAYINVHATTNNFESRVSFFY